MRKRRKLTWLNLTSFITHYVKCKKKLGVKDSTRIKLLEKKSPEPSLERTFFRIT